MTHHYDGKPYSTGQKKPGIDHPGKVEKGATSASQGKPQTGGTSPTPGKVEKGGHGITGTKAYTPNKHTTVQTKGEHTKEAEAKK